MGIRIYTCAPRNERLAADGRQLGGAGEIKNRGARSPPGEDRSARLVISFLIIALSLTVLFDCSGATRPTSSKALSDSSLLAGASIPYPRPESNCRPRRVRPYGEAKHFPLEEVAAIAFEDTGWRISDIDGRIDGDQIANVSVFPRVRVSAFYAVPPKQKRLRFGTQTHNDLLQEGAYHSRAITFLTPGPHSLHLSYSETEHTPNRFISRSASGSLPIQVSAGHFYILSGQFPPPSVTTRIIEEREFSIQDDTDRVSLMPTPPVESVVQQLVPPGNWDSRQVEFSLRQALSAACKNTKPATSTELNQLKGIVCRRFVTSKMEQLVNGTFKVLHPLCSEAGGPGYYPSDPEAEVPLEVVERYILNLLKAGYKPSVESLPSK